VILMNDNIIALATNKAICEALDCSNKATDEISLNVGKFGRISLFLCKECLPKFNQKGDQKVC
jgi:hypothetical protein